MEWLQAGVLIVTFVVWAAAVLAVLATLSINREPEGSADESSPVGKYRDSAGRFDLASKTMLHVGEQTLTDSRR
jgi:hypothetical protein